MRNVMSELSAPGAFRLILALLVFFHHSSRVNVGSAAVFVFFTLSGYWICVMWTTKYCHAHAPYFTFVTSRVWRLLPAFILCSGITWGLLWLRGVIPIIHDTVHQIISNLLIIGYNSLDYRANTSAWSLDIELQFYFIAPLLIFLTMRYWSFFFVAAAASLGTSLLDWAAAAETAVTIGPFLVFFTLGAAMAQSRWRPGPRLAWCSLLIPFVLVLFCLLSPYSPVIMGGAQAGPLHKWNNPACAALAFIMAPWALYTAQQNGRRVDMMLGDLSYILYLLHWPVLDALNSGGGRTVHHLVEISEALILTVIGSVLIWRFIDLPMNRWRARWVAGQMTVTPPTDRQPPPRPRHDVVCPSPSPRSVGLSAGA